ncbi:hypothetical protein FNV43_RR01224 [Rhamnella rubrinervis]|uniref:F-box domain-containing protein n=1 Tax=Rhamnella rubrinervis TaxID=2594499 RepID=A0A8K0HRX3_9ROSA|nr:hypothetical protein FNV43_RR01224 [Rhamnella rubrinervis]
MANSVCSPFSSSSNWVRLPSDLLGSIVDKLIHDNLSNYFRFSTVCRSWNSTALNHKAKLIPLQLPWLLFTSYPNDNINAKPKPCLYNFFMNSEISNIKLPCKFKPNMCSGSSHGRLVFMEDLLTLIVLNPFSGNTIRLPALTDAFVLRPCNLLYIIAHLKYGDESWTYSPKVDIVRVAFYKDQIFGLSRDGIVASLAIVPSSEVIKIIKDVAPKPRDSWKYSKVIKITKDIAPRPRDSWRWLIDPVFVESSHGDLLILANRLLSQSDMTCLEYKIHKLVIDSSGGVALIPIVDLGGDSLFLGNSGSVSISAFKDRKCMPNFVYHAHSNGGIIEFSFEDSSLTAKYVNLHKCLLTCFMPSMKL